MKKKDLVGILQYIFFICVPAWAAKELFAHGKILLGILIIVYGFWNLLDR